MRPLTRVAAAGLLVGSLAGALAMRPTPASTSPITATEAAVQTTVVTAAHAAASRVALAQARDQAAARHQAYLRAKAALAAAEAARAAAEKAARAATAEAVAPQPARTTVAQAASTETYLQRATRIYQSFHYDVSALGYRMVFKPSVHGLLGLTDGNARTVTVYVRSSESDLVLAHSIAHEMGHALDFYRGSEAKHQLYLSIRGISSGKDWYGCNNCTDYATPAGDWAEVFAQWLAGPGDFRSQMAGVPSKAQLDRLGELFRL